MNGRKSRRRNRKNNEISKNVIRCSLNQRIVWDNELCSGFIIYGESPNKKDVSSSEKICKNCKYSY
jgi:hypothetical protein